MLYLFEEQVLDLLRRELRRNGRVVRVEPKVFDLLVFLVENRDRLVTKDDLIAGVWGGRIVSESALSSAINAARQAVGDSGRAQRLIRTTARKGFRFVGSLVPSGSPAPGTNTVPPLRVPEPPSIAVLPFDNLGGDPGQDYFADGMTEDIITELSRLRSLFVIARNSTFSYKGKSADVRQVGLELGVRYVLEGSVRRVGGRVRATAQLIEATSGVHVWAERYDRTLEDIFELQDELTGQIVRHLQPELTAAEIVRSQRKDERDLSSWDLHLRALPLIRSNELAQVEMAEVLLRRAIAAKPDFAAAHAKLSSCRLKANYFAWEEPVPALDQALELARRAIALDPEDGLGFDALASAQQRQGRLQDALANARRAIELSPALMAAHGTLITSLAFCGFPAQAIAAFDVSDRLSPRDPDRSGRLMGLILAHFAMGNYAEAARLAEQHTLLRPNWYGSWANLAASLAYLGRLDEARIALARTIALKPDYTLAMLRRSPMYERPEDRLRLIEGLRLAGLSD